MDGGAEPGWHAVARREDVAPGEVVRTRRFGTEVVLWRGPGGALVCQEAWCPHAWADLAGARVTPDGCIECPFHAWRFDAEGSHVRLFQPPDRRERLRTFPVRERDGVAYAWYHPYGEPPEGEP